MKHSYIYIIISTFLFSACSKTEKKYTVGYQPLNEAVYASGKMMPEKYDIIKSTQTARILKINVKQGDSIKSGQSLVFLGSSDLNDQLVLLQEQVAIAKANVAPNSSALQKLNQQIQLAKTQYQQDKITAEKYSDLYQSKAVSEEAKGEKRLQAQNSLIEWENLKQTLKMQKSQLQQELISAKNQLSSFKNNHNEHNLRSSVSGVVFNINFHEGELVQAGQPIMLIGSNQGFELELLVDGRDIEKIDLGQSILFKTDVFPNQQLQATITKINPVMQESTRSFKVMATVDSKKTFYPQATVEANIIISKRDSVLMIPKSYLLQDDSVWIEENEENKKVKVQIGAENDQWIEIKSGLKKGMHIVKKD